MLLELAVLQTEGDADEAARAASGAGGRTPGQLHLNRAIVKHGVFHDRVRFTIGHLAGLRELDGLFPEKRGGSTLTLCGVS